MTSQVRGVKNNAMNETEKSSPCSACEAVSRRSFLQILAAGAGVALLHGCGSNTPDASTSPPGSTANPIAATTAGKEYQIAGAGKVDSGSAIVFITPDGEKGIVFNAADGELRALSAQCTHVGCIVEWQSNGEIHCPCHGSKFDNTGKVLGGPATKPLKTFKTRRQGDDALITLV